MKQFSFVPEVFTIPAAAHYLGVSERTVEGYIATAKVRTFRLPGRHDDESFLRRTLIKKAELDKLIARGFDF